MKVVWKYPFMVSDLVNIEMPRGARVLSVQVHKETPTMWALVDPLAPQEQRLFRCVGTGVPIPDSRDYSQFIGTIQLFEGDLVFHVFEEPTELRGQGSEMD